MNKYDGNDKNNKNNNNKSINTNKEKIENIFKVRNSRDREDILNDDLIKYYYLDDKIYCCDVNTEPLFDNIKNYDYLEPIKKLANYYKNVEPNYYNTLIDTYSNYNFEKPLYIKDSNYELDEIMLQYVKCFKNMSCLIVWSVANINNVHQTDFYDMLKKNGTVHAIKELNLNKKQIQGALYQIYSDKSEAHNMQWIQGKQKLSGIDGFNNKIFVIFYEANDFNKISGKDAPLKVKLREALKVNSNVKNDIKLNAMLHISDNNTQVVELAQLFCNKNSLRLLQYQRLDRIFNKKFYKSYVMFMTYKNWLLNNVKPINQLRFMLFSSVVMYSLGLREMNDLDILVYHLPKDEQLENVITKYIDDDKTRFHFIEITMQGRRDYVEGSENEYKMNWFNKEWPNLYGAQSMDETYFNPKFHYYYFGVKIISMIADIKRRISRCRAASYADMIALFKLIQPIPEIELPDMPTGYWKSHVYCEYNSKEIKTQIKKISFYLKNRYGINISDDEIKKIIKAPNI